MYGRMDALGTGLKRVGGLGVLVSLIYILLPDETDNATGIAPTTTDEISESDLPLLIGLTSAILAAAGLMFSLAAHAEQGQDDYYKSIGLLS